VASTGVTGTAAGQAGRAQVRAVVAARHGVDRLTTVVPDAERVELIAELERLKSAAAAVQAQLTAAMATEATAGVTNRAARARAVRSIAGQVGLARRVSPHRALSLVGMARALADDLPRTLAALADGQISEWQAMLVVRETAVLASADRRDVDSRLACLGWVGDRALAREAARLADQVDPQALARRVKRAEAARAVTISPAPGPAGCAMARLSATMPVAQAVGAYAALRRHAESRRAHGDARGLGQLMSDTLYARLTSAAATGDTTDTGDTGGTPRWPNVEVGLVMTERTLLRGGTDPALLTDDQGRPYAHVPASLARRLVRHADRVWMSRLYADPHTGELVAMDSRRRTFTGRLRRLLLQRDQTCRMPWCEAPIRHADHIHDHAGGGPTHLANAAGLCQSCNYRKQAPGWQTHTLPGPGHVIAITTPTGHRYASHPPPAPGHHPTHADEHAQRLLHDWDDSVGGTDPPAVDGAA
jgi:hypothetical protein